MMTVAVATCCSMGLPQVQGQMVGTIVTDVKVSSNVVFVGENFTVSGFLESVSGQALSGKNVTITCAHQSFLVLTNNFGVFRATVSFPAGSPSGPANVIVTYFPYPYSQDVQEYLKSNVVLLQVAVLYRASILSAKVLTGNYFPTAKPIIFIGSSSVDTSQFKFGTGSLRVTNAAYGP